MKQLKKALAVFLAILTIFTTCSVVMPVFAEYELVTNGNVTDGNVPEDTVSEEETEPQILSEITEKREENTKHFLMSDGSFMVAQYNSPVHYQDESGTWIDIDNTISETEATAEETELFGTDELYSTNNITDNVIFAEKSNSNTLVSYEAKDYPISLNYRSAKKSNIKIIEKEDELEGNNAFLTLPNVSQEVIYENVFSDVDLQYIVSPTELKENIILKSKKAQNSFTLNYSIGELTAEAVDSKTINLMAGEEVVYTISAPYMYDANGEKSENLTMTVEKNKNGKLTLILTADSTWLNAEERVYPVVVDPTVITETEREAIDSVMIAEAQPNTNYSEQSEMILGREASEYGYCRVLTKIVLPKLNKGDIIVDAQMNILNHGLQSYYDSTPDMQVNAHIITSNWDTSTVTWNNQPSYNSIVSDYDIFEEITEATWRKFDITKIAKQWYEDPDSNFGILLKGANTTGTYAQNGVKAYMYTDRYNTVEDAYPQILLTYRNNKGLEDYWTYTSLSAGAAGSAYVNDYTGNLVFAKNIISSSNELMPLSVDCVFNGYVSNVKYVSGKNKSSLAVPGWGWRLSVQQTVIPSSFYGLTGDAAKSFPYVYTDGDGTEHYIYKNEKKDDDGKVISTTLEDEDGLGLTLTVQKQGDTVTGYILTDKKDNKLTFNMQHNLIKSEDANGNFIKMTYDSTGKKLQKITDGAGKNYTVYYNKNSEGATTDYIDYITDPSGRKINFAYNSNATLNKITMPDGTTANFTYDGTDGSMLSATDNSGYQLSFAYTTAEKGKRVSSVTEYGNGSEGQKIAFDRSKYNTTVIRSAGSDGVYGNSNDLVTTYQFDNFGKTVTQQLKTAGGTDSVAGVYNYTEKDASALKSANKVSSSASLGSNVVNLLKSGNAEGASGWYDYVNDKVSSDVALSEEASYMGKKSILVNNTAVTASGGNANARQNVSGLTGGKTYTLSAYVGVKDFEKVYDSSTSGAYICVGYTGTDGKDVLTYSEYITDNTSTAVNRGWRRLTSTVTLPEGITSLKVYLGFKNCEGKAFFDCIQLEEGKVANDFNLLQNSSFENVTNNMPDNWTASNVTYTAENGNVYEGISTLYKKDGTNSVVIEGEAEEVKYLYQTIPVKGNRNDTYIVSAWGRANAVGNGENHKDAKFQISVKVYYEKENGEQYSEYKDPAKFNTTVSGWQYTAQTFTLKSKENPSYTPTHIRILTLYRNQVNHGYFDHIQLIKDVAQSYVYDSEGNIVSVSANAEQKDNMEYDGETDDLKTYTDVLGNKTTYTYDKKHNVTKAKTPGGVSTNFTYNGNGQQTLSVLTNPSETLAIRTGTGYTGADETNGIKAGAYVSVVSDEHMNRTYYTYDMLKGLTTEVKNAKGVKTNYAYDTYDRLKSVSSSGSSVSYTYNKNNLSTIKYGTDTYSFTYDNFGNVLSTKINGKALSTNTYGENNAVLEQTAYGNGAVRKYKYDSYGNLRIVENGNGTNLFSWHYDSSMTPMIHQDGINDLHYNYSYDEIGRLIRQEIRTLDNVTHLGETEFTYDLRNNVTKIANEMGGRTLAQRYYYTAIDGIAETQRYAKENLPTRYLMSNDRYIDYSYDSLNRLNKKSLTTETPYVVGYSYKMSDRNEEGETLYRTTQISTEANGTTAYTYDYDVLGNITLIRKGVADGQGSKTSSGSGWRSYEYDDLNQLVRENNKTTNETYVYTYDDYGNITSKEIHNLLGTDSEPSESTRKDTIAYTYSTNGNAGWSKLLTSYNGEAISYDAIGNPISYRGATLTWDARQLKKYVEGNTTVNYKYDADGLRSSKTVNGVTSTYQYVDGQLLYEDRNGNDIYYYYDSYGTPTAIVYCSASGSTNTVYIATNSLGDVIGLYDKNGTQIVKYEYDAWGKVVAETDVNGNALTGSAKTWSEINPFRYRGYYYDSETKLYYLQSRYYDAEVGRFLNADTISTIVATPTGLTDKNLFSYCDNNPISRIDNGGRFWGTITGAFLGAISGGIAAAIKGDNILAGIGIGALSGAIAGFALDLSLATGGLAGVVIAAAGGALSSVADDMLNNRANGREDNAREIISNAAISATVNVVSFGMSLDDGIKTGAKTFKQVFQNMKDNFVSSAFGNSSGRVSKNINIRKINLAKNIAVETISSFALDETFEYVGMCLQHVFGG